jgi:predicted HicB family RNase H-like nuclease
LLLFFVYTIILSMIKTTPSKRGRPQKPDSASEVLPPVRVTPEQKETYKEAAKFAGLSLSAWLKEAAEDKLSRQLKSGAK